MNIIDFKDVEFMTAQEKFKLVKQFERFVKGGFNWEHFTPRVYEHLHLHCGFIAHYNRHGFYETYFPNVDETFLRHFFRDGEQLNWGAGIEYGDVNKHIIELLEGVKIK